MANVSLSTRELKKALLFVSAITVLIGAIAGLIRHLAFGTDITLAYAQGLSFGISMAVAIAIWAIRRPWTINWLAKVAGRPIIHGIWFGHLHTNYNIDATSQLQRSLLRLSSSKPTWATLCSHIPPTKTVKHWSNQ